MVHPKTAILLALLTASIACGTAAPKPSIANTQGFSAEALSPASVGLAWQPVEGAVGYSLGVRYGEGDFLPAADFPSDQLTFTHFVVPGAPQVAYQLTAQTAAGEREIGSLDVNLPDLVPNPRVVGPQVFAPTPGEMLEFPVLPTLDPLNPDPSAMATAFAEFSGSNQDSMAQTGPVYIQQEIGPEGGTVTLTDPNQVVYTLEFPLEAVDRPTTITLTSIGSLSDSPFTGGLLGAVQIQPPIPFAGPLKLTIALPADSAAPSGTVIVGFAVSSFNNELSLAPIYAEGQDTYSMTVHWGDTLGLAAATLDEVVAQAARIPSDSGEQMAQQLAALRASNPEPTPEGDIRIAAQMLQGLLQQTQALTAWTSPSGGTGLAAPALGARSAPGFQLESAAKLFTAIFEAEALWNHLLIRVFPPGIAIPPGNGLLQEMAAWKEQIVAEITAGIKAYTDEHDGCRTGSGIIAETLRQILRRPETSFQQALADNYRARFGPPPSLECEFRFQIARSSIERFLPGGFIGYSAYFPPSDVTETFAVHGEPFPLELGMRAGIFFLHGPVGATYDVWEETFQYCPPTMQLRPFPSSLIWITDLRLVFDSDERVSDFVLEDVLPDVNSGTALVGEVAYTDDGNYGTCRVERNFHGADPYDVWGAAFSSLHNAVRRLDSWVIDGEDSYVATDTIAGRVEGDLTEDTTLVLTVNKK